MANIIIINKFEPNPYATAVEIDTTSRGNFKDLSPFYAGPILDPLTRQKCNNVENFWQYSKVYPNFFNSANNVPTKEYWRWRHEGFVSTKAQRYPLGKGKVPLFSLGPDGSFLDIIEARKQLYIPFYSNAVAKSKSYALLYQWFVNEKIDLVLRDFDGYGGIQSYDSLMTAVHNKRKPLGHAFVLAGMLLGYVWNMEND